MVMVVNRGDSINFCDTFYAIIFCTLGIPLDELLIDYCALKHPDIPI